MPEKEELRVAVLGVGMMGAYHAASLTDRVKGVSVTVVNDFSPQRAEEVALTIPGARVVGDPFDAIAAEDVDAVLIATPGHAHEQQLLACLERQIPVLCEKPLTLSSATAYGIVKGQAAIGRELIQIGFMRRFDPEYVRLRELLASGGLGNPLMVHCCHRNPAVPDSVTTEGVINDSAVHEVDVARFLLGEEITSVSVLHGRSTDRAPQHLSDPLLIVFETESGVVVTDELFVSSGIAYEVRTEVVGDRGIAMIGLDQNMITRTLDGRWGGQSTPNFVERFGAAYDIELQRWVNAAAQGTVDGPGAWDGYAAAAVCEAGVRSFEKGERVTVAMEARP
jgi:myo-inositol 2-dehydrogenase / D-chiro-inositol 1-dehydrogenase